ncbi:MAG: multifunctional CCA addition/repair protein [Pseudomonadales bacterium]|nr:multifunctional CCA addition/repair protein [Pseudomonadales bacterium]
MDIYLVGGAVRDKLLGYPYHEKDWVVVGATPEEMLALGYRQVGKDFPVFLHPKTQEEYALARTERKTGKGYKGFICDSSTAVTLEQDLARRDLSINAMAETLNGELIDPYNGRKDLKNKVLRHVSTAFAEDPLRVLRVARFAARYHHLGFTIADETLTLMQQIVASDEISHLVPERVWREIETALNEQAPEEFIRVLRRCGALSVIFPELDHLFGIPQTEKYHPEIDTGEHVLMALQQSVKLAATAAVRYAVLLHDLGKGLTPPDQWPAHIGHEKKGVRLIEGVGQRIKAPKHFSELAKLVARYHTHCHRALEMRPIKIMALLENTDALRRPDRFQQFLTACEADARGRLGLEDRPYPQSQYLHQALDLISQVNVKPLIKQGFKGPALGDELRIRRIRLIQQLDKDKRLESGN